MSLPAPAFDKARGVALYKGLILMAEAYFVELRSCSDIERRKELHVSLESVVRRLENDELVHHLSFIIARGLRPAHEKFKESGCPFKNLRHNTALSQQVKLQGYGVCAHCARIIIVF
jgi:hypothetical protein